MAATDTIERIAAIAARVQSVGQARAVLGKTSEILAEGYDRLADLPTGATAQTAANSLIPGLSYFLPSDANVQQAARDLLDQANGYAGKLYAELSSAAADQQTQIGITQAARMGGALQSAQKALRQIEDAAAVTYWDFAGALEQVLTAVGAFVGNAAKTVANAAAAGFWAFFKAAWPVLLVIGLAFVAYWLLRRFVRRKVAAVA